MSKARDLANAGTALTTVSATELGYLDGVTSAVQTQIDSKEATLPSQTGNTGKYLTTDGSAKSWGTVSQYALPSQTGNAGKYLTTNGTSESWDSVGITWYARKGPSVAGAPMYSFGYNGSNMYVAAGRDGLLFSSPDAITWTSRTSQFGTDGINGVTYANGIWVAVGDLGKISTSTDGINWTARTSGVSGNRLYMATYANSLWIAVGEGANGGTGGITTSTDGITWTKRTTPTTSSTELFWVAYGNGYWVAVGNGSIGGYYSTNGTSWTVMTVGQANCYCAYQNGYWYLMPYGNTDTAKVQASVPTSTWTNVYFSKSHANNPLKNTGYYNGRFWRLSHLGPSIYSISQTFAHNYFDNQSVRYPVPDNQNAGTQIIEGFYMDSSNGKMIIGDPNGRIYTSF